MDRTAAGDNVSCKDARIHPDEESYSLPCILRKIYLSAKIQGIELKMMYEFKFEWIDLLTAIDDWSSTRWHRNWQTWLPHFKFRPHIRWHEDGFEFQHGHIASSWPPRHTTATFTSHFGCGIFRISNFSGWISHGPAGRKFLSITCTLTASWHLAMHGCSHPVVSFASEHCWTHAGQSLMWHLCSFVWWHFDGILHGNWHFGGFVFFSRPQGTLIAVLPHLWAKQKNMEFYRDFISGS